MYLENVTNIPALKRIVMNLKKIFINGLIITIILEIIKKNKPHNDLYDYVRIKKILYSLKLEYFAQLGKCFTCALIRIEQSC